MLRLAAILALFFASCGGSVGKGAIEVRLVDSIPGGLYGYTHWDSSGTWIEIERNDSRYSYAELRTFWYAIVIEHELWHVLTLDGGHPNGAGCVSTELAPFDHPCPDEAAQVKAAGRTVVLSCDPALLEPARIAADWWNEALGYEAVSLEAE